MITVKNVKTLSGKIENHQIPSKKDLEIDAGGKLLLLPGIVDPHMCLGSMHTEKWNLAVQSSIRGGITTILDIPTENNFCRTVEELALKNQEIQQHLTNLRIPLNHYQYQICTRKNLKEVNQLSLEKALIKGIVIRFDSDKIEDLNSDWDNFFRLMAQKDIPILINSSSENFGQEDEKEDRETLLEKAIYYVEKWNNRLVVLNVSTEQEIDIIEKARKRSLLVYAETSLHYLFPKDHSKGECLWNALNQDTIEMIGSGYNVDDSNKDRVVLEGVNYSFSDPTFFYPLLITASNEGKIPIEKLLRLINFNCLDIFEMNRESDFVLVDPELDKIMQKVNAESSHHIKLKGWPIYTILKGEVFFFSGL